MRIRAVAVADERSNAIGVVELECTPLGLVIVYQGVGAFQEGYAPGAVTSGTRIVVPWAAVREASVDGDRLFLQLDEALTPHHRLVLAGFSAGDPPDAGEVARQRLLIRIGTGAAMAIAGLFAGLTAFRGAAEAGATAAIVLGCLAALSVLGIGMAAEYKLGPGRLEAEGVRLSFATELAAYAPGLAASLRPGTALEPPKEPPPPLPSFQALLPRSTTAVVITMSAALLGAVLTAAWVSRAPARAARDRAEVEERPRPDVPEPAANAAVAESARVQISPVPSAPAVVGPSPGAASTLLGGSCTCPRSDSLLWRDGIPRMSTVLIGKRTLQKHGHTHLEVDLGVVNNWDQSLPEVALLVQFYDRDPPPSSKRTPTYDRPLYFEGPLAPGQAIMWHVEARGDDFEVTGPPEPPLDPSGADAAPTNAIADLLTAVHRPIRLHGAMMLAFLGDPRAKEAVLKLREALREEESPFIDRLMWTLSDVRTCGVTARGGNPRTIHACVFNAGTELREDLALQVRGLDRPLEKDTPLAEPPLVVAEHIYRLIGKLTPGQGALADVALDTTNPDGVTPAAFEAHADRQEAVF